MRVVVVADAETIPKSDPQCERPTGGLSDDVYWVTAGLRRLKHDVLLVPFGLDLKAAVAEILGARPDVVFNSTEHVDHDRRKGAHVAALLELLELPYTGSGPLAIFLTIDKGNTKQILRYHGVPVPEFFIVPIGGRPPKNFSFPLFVKPLYGGGKEGITLGSLVDTRASLEKKIGEIHRIWTQPAICERYIQGRELTIAVIGNKRLETLPVRELVFSKQHNNGPRFMTERVLADRKYRERWNIQMTDARLTSAEQREIVRLSKIAYRAIGIQGYGRLDIRLGLDGRFYVVEANCNPALRPADASIIRPWGDMPFDELLSRILELALERHSRKRRGALAAGRGKNEVTTPRKARP